MQPVPCKSGAAQRKLKKAVKGESEVLKLRQHPWTPLSTAVKGQLAAVKVLLELGADVTLGTGSKEVLLRMAIEMDQGAVANFLMKLSKVG